MVTRAKVLQNSNNFKSNLQCSIDVISIGVALYSVLFMALTKLSGSYVLLQSAIAKWLVKAVIKF